MPEATIAFDVARYDTGEKHADGRRIFQNAYKGQSVSLSSAEYKRLGEAGALADYTAEAAPFAVNIRTGDAPDLTVRREVVAPTSPESEDPGARDQNWRNAHPVEDVVPINRAELLELAKAAGRDDLVASLSDAPPAENGGSDDEPSDNAKALEKLKADDLQKLAKKSGVTVESGDTKKVLAAKLDAAGVQPDGTVARTPTSDGGSAQTPPAGHSGDETPPPSS